MTIIVIVLAALIGFTAFVWLYMQQPQFGKAPAGERLERIKRSPHYKQGAFQNLSHTPALTEGVSYFKVFRQFFFEKNKRSKPLSELPSQKIDLNQLAPTEDILVWFGHSSYFLQVDGKKFLVDPVFSGNASPISGTTKSFKGSDVYYVEDMPQIDYLIITHDHFDHLDYKTVSALRPKVKTVITALGVGSHLEYWGYDPNMIIEKDWNEKIILDDNFSVYTVPTRHFSGRTFKRNNTLWMSFVLTTPRYKIFIGGDSGYDKHFKETGEQHGPFDLAILEDGQYNENWKYIHMFPEETVQAAIDLKAKKLLPVHWSKFTLSLHDWDEPIKRAVKESSFKEMPVLHPMIGEPVYLRTSVNSGRWWEKIQ